MSKKNNVRSHRRRAQKQHTAYSNSNVHKRKTQNRRAGNVRNGNRRVKNARRKYTDVGNIYVRDVDVKAADIPAASEEYTEETAQESAFAGTRLDEEALPEALDAETSDIEAEDIEDGDAEWEDIEDGDAAWEDIEDGDAAWEDIGDEDAEWEDIEDEDVEWEDIGDEDAEWEDIGDEDIELKDIGDEDVEWEDIGDGDAAWEDIEAEDIDAKDIEAEATVAVEASDAGLAVLETEGHEDSIPEIEPSGGTSPKSRRKRRIIAVLTACIVVLLIMAAGYVYYELPYRCVKEAVTIEAGEKCPPVGEFLEWDNENAYIVSGISEDMEFLHVQDHEVVIHIYSQDIKTKLHVVDTIPPEMVTRDKTIMFGEEFELEDFVEDVSDITTCEISYLEEPEVKGGGIFTFILEARDEGGNTTEKEAHLEVLQDTTPPVIEGVGEITITEGESVSYKRNITVTDDYDDAVELMVDNSEVDTDTPGDYSVIYYAVDKYGNKAEVSTVLHVNKKVEATTVIDDATPLTEEAVNEAADKILASITNPSMSQYEIIRAIYDWCNTKIAYVNEAPKSSWVEGAYYGLVKRRGDCYTYAMTAKCLLNRAGIVNMDIERVRVGNGMHFWNLVDIGEGWRHFDTCRRVGNPNLFYLTDAELMAYSNAHTAPEYPNGSHYYDRTLYPVIP